MNWLAVAAGVLVGAGVLMLAARLLLMRRTALPVGAQHIAANNGVDWTRFETSFTETDRMVDRAERIWPYVFGDSKRTLPVPATGLFYFNALSSAVLIYFGANAAYALALGSVSGLLLFGLLATTAQLMQWGVSIRKDPMDTSSLTLLIMLTVFNVSLGLIGASVFGNTQDTRTAITVNATTDAMAKRDALAKELTAVQARRSSLSLETLQAQAKSARDREVCESWLGNGRRVCPQDKVEAREYGGKCGPKCLEYKAEADKLAAQVADAQRERAIQSELAGLNKSLGDKLEAAPLRTRAEFFEIGGEKIGQAHVLPAIVIFIALIDAFLCFQVGKIAREKHAFYVNNAKEAANAILEERGLPPRYKTLAQQEAVEAKPAAADQYTINVAPDFDEAIAQSEDLRRIHALFGDVIVEDEIDPNAELTFGRIFAAYRARAMAAQAAGGRGKWLSQAQFLSAMDAYVKGKKIHHAGSRLIGWRLAAGEAVAVVPTQQEESAA